MVIPKPSEQTVRLILEGLFIEGVVEHEKEKTKANTIR